MLDMIRGLFGTPSVPKLPPIWGQVSDRRRAHTPDLLLLTEREQHLVFVYDDMKQGFPLEEALWTGDYVSQGITKASKYALWRKKYRNEATAVAVEAPTPTSLRWDPMKPDPQRIRGELHLVPTETVFKLDEAHANGIYFKRERIDVQLPLSDKRWVKNAAGDWVPDEFPYYVQAHAYISSMEVIDDEPRHSVRPVASFTPPYRANNLKYRVRRPYYEFTKRDL